MHGDGRGESSWCSKEWLNKEASFIFAFMISFQNIAYKQVIIFPSLAKERREFP
jgi:hypothetical protein